MPIFHTQNVIIQNAGQKVADEPGRSRTLTPAIIDILYLDE
jgi:hypothetical protein